MTHRWLTPLVIFLLAPFIALAAQKATFSVEAEEVRIDVSVTENGRPVSGLSAVDFEVLDNGVPQDVRYATLQSRTPVSATLIFDLSNSVAGQLLDHLKEAARAFLNDLKKEDQAALITFNHAVILGSAPTRDLQRIRLALDQAQPFGNSALIDGSYAGLVLAQTSPNPPLLIVFSDGRDTVSWLTGDSVLETAKRNGAVVYAVSPSPLPEKTFLRDLAKLTGGLPFEVKSTSDLAATFLSILDEFRQRYLITYTPRGVSESGWHKLEVRMKNRSSTIRARPGYLRASAEQR